jgi:outer membrane protein assembly factor BamB
MLTTASRALFTLLLLTVLLRADNWTQWRGPTNNGLTQAKGLPSRIDPKTNLLWSLDLPGEGSSTPAIWGDKIFLSADDGKDIVVLCISTEGKTLWTQKLGPSRKAGRGDEGNCASPSPSTDGKAVYFFAGNGHTAAFDFAGKELWRFNAEERYGKFKIAFGLHSTPVLHEGKLYLQLIHDGGGQIACVEAATGKEVWAAKRVSDGVAENKHAYTSPFLWSNGKEAYLVVHGNDYATAHSLKDGSEIWRVGDLNPKGPGYRGDLRFVASPVCTPELIVIPTAKSKSIVAIKPTAKGRVKPGSEHEVWRHDKGTPDVPSPLVHDGLVYLAGESGSLACLDAATGKEYYRKPVQGGRHRANPLLADGKIWMLSRDGSVSAVEIGKEFKKVFTEKLPDEFAASPIAVDGRLVLRGLKKLWVFGEKK